MPGIKSGLFLLLGLSFLLFALARATEDTLTREEAEDLGEEIKEEIVGFSKLIVTVLIGGGIIFGVSTVLSVQAIKKGAQIVPVVVPVVTPEPDLRKRNVRSMSATIRMQPEPVPVYKVVLTGAPCGGKTTSLHRLRTKFQELGYRVYGVPEVANLLFAGGVNPARDLGSASAVYHFQDTLIKTLTSLEDAFQTMAANSGQKSIIFCDRGTMDARAYMEESVWQAMLDENGWTNVSVRDKRYDCVVHLVTAAIGAEKYYVTGEGTTRHETVEEAAELDSKIRKAWIGHPYLVVVDNSTNFEQKLDRVVDVVCKRLEEGKVESAFRKRKFLVRKLPDEELYPKPFQEFHVEHVYLTEYMGAMRSIRKRGQYGSYTYTLISKKNKVETRRTITGREFVAFLDERDVTRHAVRQKRRYFMWKESVFHLDRFFSPVDAQHIIFCQAYLRQDDKDVIKHLPPFLDVEKEVTGVEEYSMYEFCRIDRSGPDTARLSREDIASE